VDERFAAFAQAAPGLSHLVAEELRGLGLEVVAVGPDGVDFEAGYAGLYRANLGLRTAGRVLVRIARFKAAHFNQLEKGARQVAWRRWCDPTRPVAFRVSAGKSRLNHKRAIEQRLRSALPGAAQPPGPSTERAASSGEAPPGTPQSAEHLGPVLEDAQLFVVRMQRDRCTISVDTSGELLHRRGYRQDGGKAPLRETLAAAVVLGSGWTPDRPLTDGFCGSGTIAIEAALIAAGIPPGARRSFAIERWPHFPSEVIESERAAWASRTAVLRPRIWASDRDAGAVARTIANAERAGVRDLIAIHEASISEVEGFGGDDFFVSNPPYGVRVRGGRDLRDLYDRWGAVLQASFSGGRCGVLAPGPELVGRLGFPFEVALRTKNGGLPVSLFNGEIP